MNKPLSVTIIGILLVASFFIGYSIKEATTQDIPSSVLEKYYELEPQYRAGGARIDLCTKNNEIIYKVSSGVGYAGVAFYYTEDGIEIGSYSWTDVIDPNNLPPEPPINIGEYECTVIKI